MPVATLRGARPLARPRMTVKPPLPFRPLGGPKGVPYRAFLTGTLTNAPQSGPAKMPPKARRRIVPKRKPVVQLGAPQQGQATAAYRPRMGRGGGR